MALSQQVERLVDRLDKDRIDAAKTYVRQDVYIEARRADAAVVADLHGDIKKVETSAMQRIDKLEADRKTDLDKRRQVWLAISAMAITIVVAVVGFIIQLTAR